ncbi:meiotically up-regulated gene 113-domain-containing protein [Aspergillus keveii]|uniref:Meiotically up-regulated gene 113-domain-containing protein n=1 Tax=Aspergillus keveii TaxID=714993 RepID=A0ABR4FUM8_9EURO
MTTMTESGAPQTPTWSQSPIEPIQPSLQTPSTPPASPEDDAASIFSPNESVSTDITDYGWDTPSRKVSDDDDKRLSFSLPTPKIVVEDTDTAADIDGTERRTFVEDTGDSAVSEAIPDIRATEPAGKIDTAPSPAEVSPSGAAPDDSNARLSALTTDKDSPVPPLPGSAPVEDHNTSASAITTDKAKWSPLASCPPADFTFHSAPEGIPNRRCSFNSDPNTNFISDGQVFRNKPRAKSTGASASNAAASIQTFRAEIGQSGVSPSTTEMEDKKEPTEEGSRPARPMGKEDLKLLESLKNLIPPLVKETLVQNGVLCVATTQARTRCSKPAKGPTVTSALQALDNPPSLDAETLHQTTETLFSLLLCGTHKNVANKLSVHWRPTSSLTVSNGSAVVLEEWLKAVRGTATPSPLLKPDVTPSVEVVIPPLDTRLKTALPDFVEYHPPDKPRLSVAEKLEKFIVAPLTPADADHSGHIYIYQCKGKFGYYKVGLTTDLAPRLQSWEKQCGRELMSYFPRSEEDLLPVPHISRVEKLIHAELAEYRRKEECCKATTCGKAHQEWFQVEEQHALRVVRKWIAWMRKEPYVQINGGSTWVLAIHRVGSIKEICTPLSNEIPLQVSLQSAPSLAVPTAPKGRKRSKSMC